MPRRSVGAISDRDSSLSKDLGLAFGLIENIRSVEGHDGDYGS